MLGTCELWWSGRSGQIVGELCLLLESHLAIDEGGGSHTGGGRRRHVLLSLKPCAKLRSKHIWVVFVSFSSVVNFANYLHKFVGCQMLVWLGVFWLFHVFQSLGENWSAWTKPRTAIASCSFFGGGGKFVARRRTLVQKNKKGSCTFTFPVGT